MEPQFTGLRCQDISLDLRSGTADSWVLSTVDNTQLVGMAADLAGLIRGRNVLVDIDALKIVAREALGINARVLPSVLDVLEGSAGSSTSPDPTAGSPRSSRRCRRFAASTPSWAKLAVTGALVNSKKDGRSGSPPGLGAGAPRRVLLHHRHRHLRHRRPLRARRKAARFRVVETVDGARPLPTRRHALALDECTCAGCLRRGQSASRKARSILDAFGTTSSLHRR